AAAESGSLFAYRPTPAGTAPPPATPPQPTNPPPPGSPPVASSLFVPSPRSGSDAPPPTSPPAPYGYPPASPRAGVVPPAPDKVRASVSVPGLGAGPPDPAGGGLPGHGLPAPGGASGPAADPVPTPGSPGAHLVADAGYPTQDAP